MSVLSPAGPRALLALEDGSVFAGHSFGAQGTRSGEVCFNTGMTGYQEVLTDPSYHGQIVTMTSPHIGNTGANEHDDQSLHPWVAGFVVREVSASVSSWRAQERLQSYLDRHGVPGITGIDTRRLTRVIRSKGALRGALSTEVLDAGELVDIARSAPSMVGLDLATEVSTSAPYRWGVEELSRRAASGFAAGAEGAGGNGSMKRLPEPRYRVAAYDFGIKRNILDLFVAAGFEVTVLPARTPARDVLEGGYDGVFLSNGPGDPDAVACGIEAAREIVGRLALFGICLGHQILGLALEGRTFKLPFGHRGSNHPVKRNGQERIEITCQNHGFAVDPGSLPRWVNATHVNLNDGTLEGLEVPDVCYGVQYHPEAGPGPHDSRYLLGRFRGLIERFEPVEPESLSA